MKLDSKSEIKGENITPIMELYTKKKDNITDENIFKCRFRARGYLQQEYLKFYSPTARRELIRTFLFAVSSRNMLWMQIDIGNAFLNAELEKEYYCKLPMKLQI
eukprot:snap_masked-scaffold_39-processed-gene-2.42-mRNA-1 protein AED:1.00 eAED:1.00 QI:0/-1/0/0/-1/1/1/0/103